MAKSKAAIMTFKVEPAVRAALDGMPNRSEFIRQAILAALGQKCPLCQGTGFLSAEQQKHWAAFSATHRVEECSDCRARHLVCSHSAPAVQPHPGGGKVA
jgi:hypothetical protein